MDEEPVGPEPAPVGERSRPSDGGQRRLLIAGGLIAMFGLFGVLSWYAYREARDMLRGELRLVRAPEGPYRTRPEDPGGLPVLNESAPIVTVLEGREEPAEPERIIPSEEPPARSARELLPPAAAPSAASPTTSDVAPSSPPSTAKATEEPPAAGRERATVQPLLPGTAGGIATGDTPPPMPEQLLAEELQDMEVAPEISGIEPAAGDAPDAADEEESPVPPALRDEPAPPPTRVAARREPEAAAPAPAGPVFRIQLAALSDEAAASRAWDRFRRRYGALLEGLEPVVEPARRGERTLYRVQAGTFASREEARARCARIKKAGGDCFVVGPLR